MKIEIGGGKNPRKGYLNIDKIQTADKVVDLETDRLPFDDESVDAIYSCHTFEQINNIIHLMNECWRVMKFGAELTIIVPHLKCTLAWQDPTHERYFNEESMKYFCGNYLKKYKLDYGINCCFKLLMNKVTAPDNRPNYLLEIKFILAKDKKHYTKVNYPKKNMYNKLNGETTETEQEIIDIIKQRQAKGRETYGTGLDFRQGNGVEDWINQAIEEAADMLQYLVALKMRLKK